jgi:hypothetical protein
MSAWRGLPPLARFGFGTIGLGGVADTIAHLFFGPPPGQFGFTGPQYAAHLVIFGGMVAALGGIILDAIWPANDPQQ